MMAEILIAGGFLVLLVTHYIAIKVGFSMGVKTDFNKIMSVPGKESKPQTDYVDPYNKEMLDFD